MNFFGQQKPKGKNPLAALMQPQLMEMLQQEQGPATKESGFMPVQAEQGQSPFSGGFPQLGRVGMVPQPPSNFNPEMMLQPGGGGQEQPPSIGAAMQQGWNQGAQQPPQNAAPARQQETPGQAMQRGWSQGSDGPPPQTPDVPVVKDLMPSNLRLDLSGKPTSSPGNEARDAMFGSKDGPMHEPPPEDFGDKRAAAEAESGMTTEDKEKNLDTALGGTMFGHALAATQDMLKQYGQAAQTMEGAKLALKNEFQDTPELDAIISKTERELASTKGNRKQPGIGEFLTMAMLNLSGMNPRQSADMVLGLGEQRQDEQRLEGRLADLEGSRAGAKMQGRQAQRSMERQDKYQQLQNALRQQETGRKQANEDREFGFKGQKLGVDKLMQALGQLRQQMAYETDPMKKKALQAQIDKMDPYGQRGQQQQKPPTDRRQSMLFGDLVGGGGYA